MKNAVKRSADRVIRQGMFLQRILKNESIASGNVLDAGCGMRRGMRRQ